jgi:hypothetical protein
MTFKKILKNAMFIILISIAIPASSSIVVPHAIPSNSPAKMDDARATQLLQRLKDIKTMDMSEMSRLERKSLRKEIKGIKKDLKASGRGIYLSVGAVIIIILLLILLT